MVDVQGSIDARFGYGGSLVVCDRDARLCVAYVMNRMYAGTLGDQRGARLLDATLASLG